MARAFTRLSLFRLPLFRLPLFRLMGLVLVLGTLSACVAPRHGGYHGGGGYGRSYAQHQPVFRGGYDRGHQRRWR